MLATTTTDTSTSTIYPGGYSPGDTGNWSDIGPWFATVIFALVLAPFAFHSLMNAVRRVFGMA